MYYFFPLYSFHFFTNSLFLDTTYDDWGTTTYNNDDKREGQDDKENSPRDVIDVPWALVCVFFLFHFRITNSPFLNTTYDKGIITYDEDDGGMRGTR
jgi:hypothetical protein